MSPRTRPTSTSTHTVFSNQERRFIEHHRVAHLATADATGAPHVIPICYALSDDCFYFVIDEKPKRTRTALKRLRNIRENPRAALVIDDYDDDWARLAFLLVQGQATIVRDDEEYGSVLKVLRARYPQYRAMPLRFATHPMVRITPQRAHMWRAAK